MASTYLSRTPSSTTNRRTFTLSYWIKFSDVNMASAQKWFSAGNDGTGNLLKQEFFSGTGTRTIALIDNNNNGTGVRLTTKREFRDGSGWYHIVYAVDTTQATASNRVKMYVNGEQNTDWYDSSTHAEYPNQNYDFNVNVSGQAMQFGRSFGFGSSSPNYFDGCMSHIHFIDGTAYDASYFGETDATTGEWKINTSPSVTYGTNGFFILKDSNSVTDQSGNGNNFTVGGGTLTNTEDNPSNVFATMNSLDQKGGMTFSEGNLSVASTSASWRSTRGTLGVTQGKWYYELKVTNVGGSLLDMMVGWGDFEIAIPSEFSSSNPALLYTAGGDKRLNGVLSSYGASYNINDIIGVAFDADNLTVEFFKNGTSQGSISTGWSSGITWTPIISLYGRYNNTKASFNFGNGYFGTTAVSSAGTNASGIGIFEHDVPNGYTSLSTKGLNL